MKNVDIAVLAATLKEEVAFCKKNGIKDHLQHMVDSWYVDSAYLEVDDDFLWLKAQHGAKSFEVIIFKFNGYYMAHDVEVDDWPIKSKSFKSKDFNTFIIGLLIYFKMSI